SLGWGFPFFSRWVGPSAEIHPVPKLLMDPFTGVVKYADQPSPILAEAVRDLGDFLLRRGHRSRIVQLHSRIVRPHVIDHDGVLEPKWAVVQPDVGAFIHITADSMGRHANLLQARDGLSAPG